MGFIILVRSSSVVLFFVELAAGVNLIGSSWLFMQWYGVAGLGMGFLFTYIVHYLIVWIIVRRDIHLIWTLENRLMFISAALVMLVIRLLPGMGLDQWRTPVALALAFIVGLGSLNILTTEIGGIKNVRAWLRGNPT